ncbi:MAG TPA: hypothetical protein VHU13_06125 [Solirubrobacteraceae bacterium]|nr:hypothetical protein [Solirubrobacteraceae bacterium]
MRAGRCFRVIVRRGGLMPAFLASPDRRDHVEVVEIDGGEVVFFWDLPPQTASRVAREVREELGVMEREDFLARWSTVEDR